MKLREKIIKLGEIYWLATSETRGNEIDIVEGPFTSYLQTTTRRLELAEAGQKDLRIMSADVEAECNEVIGQMIWDVNNSDGHMNARSLKEPESVKEGQERLAAENAEEPKDQEKTRILWNLIQPKLKELKKSS